MQLGFQETACLWSFPMNQRPWQDYRPIERRRRLLERSRLRIDFFGFVALLISLAMCKFRFERSGMMRAENASGTV